MFLTIGCCICVILFNKVSYFVSWEATLKQSDMRTTVFNLFFQIRCGFHDSSRFCKV